MFKAINLNKKNPKLYTRLQFSGLVFLEMVAVFMEPLIQVITK